MSLKICQNCETGHLHFDVRDVTITRNSLSTTVSQIAGLYCDACEEIEFDDSTDSAKRFAEAGDWLVLRSR